MSDSELSAKLLQIAEELERCNAFSEASEVNVLRKKLIDGINDRATESLAKKIRSYCTAPRGYVEIGGGTLDGAAWANLLAEVGARLKTVVAP